MWEAEGPSRKLEFVWKLGLWCQSSALATTTLHFSGKSKTCLTGGLWGLNEMLRVEVPVNYKFRENRVILEHDKTGLNVGIIIQEQKADDYPWFWAMLWSQVCGSLSAHFPFYDISLLKSYRPLLNAALWLTCWFWFVWFWLYKMHLLIPAVLLLGQRRALVRKWEETNPSCNQRQSCWQRLPRVGGTWLSSCLPLGRADLDAPPEVLVEYVLGELEGWGDVW